MERKNMFFLFLPFFFIVLIFFKSLNTLSGSDESAMGERE